MNEHDVRSRLRDIEFYITKQEDKINNMLIDIEILKKDYAKLRVQSQIDGTIDEMLFRKLAATITESEHAIEREGDVLQEFKRCAANLRLQLIDIEKEQQQKVFDILAVRRYKVNAEIEETAVKLKTLAMRLKGIDEGQRDAVRKGKLQMEMQSPLWQVKTFLANIFHSTPIAYGHKQGTNPQTKGKGLNEMDTLSSKKKEKKRK